MNSKIKSVGDAIESLINCDFERGQLIFRGQVNFEWELLPKILRLKNEDPNALHSALFEPLLNGNEMPYLYSYDPILYMMNLQHFGIPTRLLDWTSELLIALFFACYDPDDKYENKDGIFYIIDRYQYKHLNLNGSENNIFKNGINHNNLENAKKRILNDDFLICEPVFKNPRMRVQDGCFMFFSFLPLDIKEKKFVTLHEYHKAQNKYIEKQNKEQGKSDPKFWIGSQLIDKYNKKSIMHELDKNHGISAKSIFVEIDNVKQAEEFYGKIYSNALKKAEWIKSNRIT